MDRSEQKEIIKEAIKEWLDDQFKTFGKWTARGLAVIGFSAFVYFIGTWSGWKIG